MNLPGRLAATTLGDLLGTLHRGGSNGTLELIPRDGRVHRIHLVRGLVAAVELDGGTSSLADVLRRESSVEEGLLRRSLLRAMAQRRLHGEVLVSEFALSPSVVDGALRRQIALRLDALDRLEDAQVRFRVAVRPPRGALVDRPLGPTEFLGGRRRARDRGPFRVEPPQGGRGERPFPRPFESPNASAFVVLGLPTTADAATIRRAYRRLARELHPDLHPRASEEERSELARRFREVTTAYRRLVA